MVLSSAGNRPVASWCSVVVLLWALWGTWRRVWNEIEKSCRFGPVAIYEVRVERGRETGPIRPFCNK